MANIHKTCFSSESYKTMTQTFREFSIANDFILFFFFFLNEPFRIARSTFSIMYSKYRRKSILHTPIPETPFKTRSTVRNEKEWKKVPKVYSFHVLFTVLLYFIEFQLPHIAYESDTFVIQWIINWLLDLFLWWN